MEDRVWMDSGLGPAAVKRCTLPLERVSEYTFRWFVASSSGYTLAVVYVEIIQSAESHDCMGAFR